jgi:hypothetical protein
VSLSSLRELLNWMSSSNKEIIIYLTGVISLAYYSCNTFFVALKYYNFNVRKTIIPSKAVKRFGKPPNEVIYWTKTQ